MRKTHVANAWRKCITSNAALQSGEWLPGFGNNNYNQRPGIRVRFQMLFWQSFLRELDRVHSATKIHWHPATEKCFYSFFCCWFFLADAQWMNITQFLIADVLMIVRANDIAKQRLNAFWEDKNGVIPLLMNWMAMTIARLLGLRLLKVLPSPSNGHQKVSKYYAY